MPEVHNAAPKGRHDPSIRPGRITQPMVVFKGRREQPLPIRIVHWCNALFLILMAGSGLQIFMAYPSLGPRGAQYAWYPFQGTPTPAWTRIGGWLAGGRHWHFAIAWFFVAQRDFLSRVFLSRAASGGGGCSVPGAMRTAPSRNFFTT